jgi:glucose/mannose-6-phosphate isomerase
MNLDDLTYFKTIDTENMLPHIQGLPDQLLKAWQLGHGLPLPDFKEIRGIVIAGMGGSAIGADLLCTYVSDICPVPVYVLRDYDLPAWAKTKNTLFIASSHSGNTEETLSAFNQAQQAGCQIMAITTGGQLAEQAQKSGIPLWIFDHKGQPRTAVGFSFGLLLALFNRLKLIPNQAELLAGAVTAMKDQMLNINAEIPVTRNPAKRMAGQLFGHWVAVFGSGFLAPVSRRWKGQISEIAKAWGQFEFLPELDHNTMAGLLNPPELVSKNMILFLKAASDHPRNKLRSDITRQGMMVEGFNTDFIEAKGDSPLAHMWTCLHMGDFIAYYLAMAYGVDPTPVDAIEDLKKAMKK